MHEETGIQEFTIGKIVATHLLSTDSEPRIGMLLVLFRCTTQTEKITLTPEEHDMYGWFSKNEIEKLEKFEGDEDVYRKIAVNVLED